MRQRSTWDETVVFPTATPPVTVHPGEEFDHARLLPGCVALDGDTPEPTNGPVIEPATVEPEPLGEPVAELPPPHLPLLGGLTVQH